MKIRSGFVSNSSSSSFVCSVCGCIESGMDVSEEDLGMLKCINGHTFHTDCSKLGEPEYETFEQKKEYLINAIKSKPITSWFTKKIQQEQLDEVNGYTEEDEGDLDDNFHDTYCDFGVGEEYCPICSMEEIDNDEMIEYLFKVNNLNKKDILKEVKSKFSSYAEFAKFIEVEGEK